MCPNPTLASLEESSPPKLSGEGIRLDVVRRHKVPETLDDTGTFFPDEQKRGTNFQQKFVKKKRCIPIGHIDDEKHVLHEKRHKV